MTSQTFTLPYQTVLDGNGNPVSGALAFFYQAGTTTLQDVFTTSDLATAHTNPVVADSSGRLPPIYLNGSLEYRVIIRNSDNNLVYDSDDFNEPLTAAEVGRAIYARSAGEISASVTPTTFIYPPGDIRRYGAVGDGATDDAPAITTASDANERVIIPGDLDFRVNQSVIVTTATNFVGDGASIGTLSAGFDVFDVRSSDVTFSGISFTGSATDDSTGQYAIFTDSAFPANRLHVTNCQFGGGLNNGIKVDDACDDAFISGNYFEYMVGTSAGSGYGVLCGATENAVITGNRFLADGTRGRHGVYLSTGASYCVVSHNVTEGYINQHIAINAADTQSPNQYNIIDSNICIGGQTNASTGQIAIFGQARGNKISNNTLINSGENGILLIPRFGNTVDQDVDDNEICNNLIINAGAIGIDVWGTNRTKIQGNTIRNASANGSGVSASIRLRASDSSGGVGCVDAFIEGNNCTGANQRASLQLNSSTPTPTGTIVRNNRFDVGTVAQIEDNSIAYDGERSGSATITDGNTTAVVTHGLASTPSINDLTLTAFTQGTNDPGHAWIDTITSTQFRVNVTNDPGSSGVVFRWRYHPS